MSNEIDGKVLQVLEDGHFYDKKTGNTYMMPKDKKIKYYNMLLNVPIIRDNKIVSLIFHEKNDMVHYDALVGFNDKYGGFSAYGFIELSTGYIGVNYDSNNDNNYQYIGYKIGDLETKGKVK